MMTPVIFYKDLRIGLKNLLLAPAALVVAYLGLKLVWEGHYGRVISEQELANVSVVLLATFNSFIAIIAGAQVSAEEKTAGTNLFLARLPISKRHLYIEKVAAGLCGIAVLYVATLAYLSFFDLDKAWKGEVFGTIEEYFFISMFSAYFLAIACSRYTQQSIAIMLVSFGAECMLWGVITLVRTTEALDWHAIRLAILFSLLCFIGPGILVWRQWQLPQRPDLWGAPHRRTRMRGLMWKTFAENGLLHVMCLLLMLATLTLGSINETIRSGDSVIGAFIPILGVLLIAALGTSCYAVNERRGLMCVAYYHPIPRGHLFATKLLVAIPAILMVSTALVLTVSETIPAISVFVLCFLVYLLAVQACLTYQKGTVVVILAALLGAFTVGAVIAAWIVPTDHPFIFAGFTPVHDPQMVALIPLAFVTLGSMATGWRLATNRRFLAGSDLYRQQYTLVCFLVVGLVTSALVSVIREFVVL